MYRYIEEGARGQPVARSGACPRFIQAANAPGINNKREGARDLGPLVSSMSWFINSLFFRAPFCLLFFFPVRTRVSSVSRVGSSVSLSSSRHVMFSSVILAVSFDASRTSVSLPFCLVCVFLRILLHVVCSTRLYFQVFRMLLVGFASIVIITCCSSSLKKTVSIEA